MKNLLFLIFILFATVSVAQNNGFDEEKIKQIKDYRSIKLENGLTIMCLETQDSSDLFIRAFTNLPQYVPEEYRAKIAIDFEMRQDSAYKLPLLWSSVDLSTLNIKLDKDEKGFYASCPVERIDTVIALFSDLLLKPIVEVNNLGNSKYRLLHQSDSLRKLPVDRIDRITKSVIYGKEHATLKYADSAQTLSITPEKYLEFYHEFYKPNNSFILVMGNISLDSVKTLINNRFGEWKEKDVPESSYKLIPIKEPKILFFDTIPAGNTSIKIVFPFALYPFTFNSEKGELLSLLFQDLLNEKLVDSLKLANKIEARFESDKITGNYQLNVYLEKDSLNQAVQAIISAISDLSMGRYPEEKLEIAKHKVINQFKESNTSLQHISNLILKTEVNGLSKEYYANFIDDINNTDKAAIQKFAVKYLNYNTSLFQIPGNWYKSLNDFIKLCKDFRIELYDLDGRIKKVIPKGFNGFSVIDNYVEAIGGRQNIKKIKDVSIKYGAIYELENDVELLVEGEMKHKAENKFFSESQMIRPKKDTIFMHRQIFDGINGIDSTMQGTKRLQNTKLELLKYKSPFVPEMQYKNWNYKARLVQADTLDEKHVWVVVIDNPAKQHIIDYYDVDTGIKYMRVVKDNAYFNERIVHYGRYQRDDEKKILYPFYKRIESKNTTIKMLIREVDYKTRVDRKLFDIE